MMKNRTVLITGGTGYVGSMLVRKLLEQGYDIDLIVREKSSLTLLEDIVDMLNMYVHDGTTESMIDIVSKSSPYVVIHLASLFLSEHKTSDVSALIESNLHFSTQLLEAVAVNEVRYFVNTGTSWQHYDNDAYNPVNLYAATKQAFEDILEYYLNTQDINAISLILFDTYGPNDPRGKLISLLWKTAKYKEKLSMSPGEQLIDIVHIDDVVNAFISGINVLVTNQIKYERYAVSSGAPIKLKDLVTKFEQSTGVGALPIDWGARPYRYREVMKPWSNYKTVPNWSPKVPFELGVINSYPKDYSTNA